jgi:glutamine synthetase
MSKDAFVKIAITDINGVLRSKHISKAKFDKARSSGFGFCDVIVGSDINDQLIDNLHVTGWQTGYPDALVNIIESTQRVVPYEDDVELYLCEFDSSNSHFCPRQTLKRVIDYASNLGFKANAGMEFEFTLFEETPNSSHKKNFHNLNPLTPGNCGYSYIRSAQYSEFYTELLDTCNSMSLPLEGLHTEIGPGVLEAAIGYSDILTAADNAVLFKNIVKTLAFKRGLSACFMAKWSVEHQGQSGHIHLSLQDENNEPVFFDSGSSDKLSDVMRYFIAGQQLLMPECLLLTAPFINSYARLVPGYWAPTQASWGIDNRTCAIRAILGSNTSQRIEYRIPGADSNPYLAMSVALASGLYGVEEKLSPSPAMTGNAYEQTMTKEYQLPRTLLESARRFRDSTAIKRYFDQKFIDDYATTREWEGEQYQKAVTDWQLKRYFELV